MPFQRVENSRVHFNFELNANTMILKTHPKSIAFEVRDKKHKQNKR